MDGHKSLKSKKNSGRIRRGIIKDAIHPKDFNSLQIAFACEHCSYFERQKQACNLGFNCENHRLHRQIKTYNMGGKMALCRFLEVD